MFYDEKAKIIWYGDLYELVDKEEMGLISSMLMQDHLPRVNNDEYYLKEECMNCEIFFCEEKTQQKRSQFKVIHIFMIMICLNVLKTSFRFLKL